MIIVILSQLFSHAAALVIQGSASVYGRKVEYLHNLVYAALNAIANKRCNQSLASNAAKESIPAPCSAT